MRGGEGTHDQGWNTVGAERLPEILMGGFLRRVAAVMRVTGLGPCTDHLVLFQQCGIRPASSRRQ